MVCVSRKRRQSFLLPISARADSPAFESRDELRASASGQSWEDAMRRSFVILSLLPVALLVSSASLAQNKLDASIQTQNLELVGPSSPHGSGISSAASRQRANCTWARQAGPLEIVTSDGSGNLATTP